MSKYTTEVRYICETAAGLDESVGYDSINSVVQEAAPKIFNFDFPIFDSAYRLPLEMKILKHYYTREICEETVGLWKLRLETRMNEIMPYYNKLYTSETLQFNPLYDVDYTREYTKDTSGETTGTEVVRDSGTVADAKTGSDTLTDTVSDVLEKTGTESVARTGTNTLDKTGTDTLTNTGTDTSAKTGTETVRDTGTDTSAKTGTEQVGSSGTITDQGTNSNTETRNYSDATTIGKDTWDLYSDTPQGGINGLLDNGQVESGTDLPNNTYLTNARHIMESGNAGTTVHSGTVDNSGTDSNTRTLGTTETTTHNTQDQRTLNTTATKTYDTEDERTLNTTGQRTLNTKDKTTVALDDTTTFDTEDSREISGTHQQVYNSTNTKTLNTTKSGNTSGTITNTDEYVERVYGKTGGYTYSKALMEYRKTLLNIDMMIIDDLKDLFFGLW